MLSRLKSLSFAISFLVLGIFISLPQGVSATLAGDNIIISEVEYDSIQGGGDASYEWIELYNPTASPIDVSNWELKEGGSPTHTFTPGTIIGSGQYFLLVNNTTNFNINYPAVTPDVEMSPDLSLNNGGDELTLWDGVVGVSTIVDYVAWEGYVAGWGTPNAPPGQSICRTTATDTDTQADWTACATPTPGSGSLGLASAGPGGIVNDLALWLRADTGTNCMTPGCAISQWDDQSVTGANATQVTTTSQPVFTSNAQHFNPSLYFAGDDQHLGLTDLINPASTELSLFAIGSNETGGDTWHAIVSGQASAAWSGGGYGLTALDVGSSNVGFWVDDFSTGSGAPFQGVPQAVLGGIYDGAQTSFSLDGTVQSTSTQTSAVGDNGSTYIGGNGTGTSYNHKGYISEVALFTKALSAADQLKINSYFALKYGITLSGDYQNGGGSTIWNATGNAGYTNDVAGLVQDDDSLLHQKVAQSINTDALLIGAMDQNFTATNQDALRTTAVGNGNSVIWGNNNATTTFTASFSGAANTRMGRIWKFDETGTVGNIYIAIPNSISFPSSPKVVVSSDATFDTADTIINLTDDGTYYWAQIDPADGDFISFVSPLIPTIFINEVEYDSVQGGADTVYEWVELYNPSTTSTVDISGWTLADDDAGQEFTIPAATTIAPGAIYLLVNDTASFNTNYPAIVPDVDMASSLELSNSGDPLTLRNGSVATGDVIDFVEWENTVGGWPLFAGINQGESICRISLIDTGTVSDWDDCSRPNPGIFGVIIDVELPELQPGQQEQSTPIGSISLLLNGPLLATSTIELADLATGTATEGVGNDYTFSSPQTLSILPGVYSGSTPTVVSVPGLALFDDILVEQDETIDFAIQNPSSLLFMADTDSDSFTRTTTTYMIADNDLGGGSVRTGCMDPLADNYDEWARKTDNSCTYPVVPPTTTPTPPITPSPEPASFCKPLLTASLRLGQGNDPLQVASLKQFLNTHEGEALSSDGIFDQQTHEAVVRFQDKYKEDVLDFWNLDEGTGYVFLTTRAKINAMNCMKLKPALSCPYFSYIEEIGAEGEAVSRLQTFLNTNEGASLTMSSTFDSPTQTALHRYQEKYRETVLVPWGLTESTGLLLQTTRKQLHRDIGCFELPVLLPNGTIVE